MTYHLLIFDNFLLFFASCSRRRGREFLWSIRFKTEVTSGALHPDVGHGHGIADGGSSSREVLGMKDTSLDVCICLRVKAESART